MVKLRSASASHFGQESPRRRREPVIGDAIEPRPDRAGDVAGEPHRDAGCFHLGALGIGRAVEEQLGRAVRRDHRDAVAFQDAEIRDVAQVVALPGIAVHHDLVDAGRLHRGEQPSAARVSECGGVAGIPYSAALCCASSKP